MTIYEAAWYQGTNKTGTIRLWANSFENAFIEVEQYNARGIQAEDVYYLACRMPGIKRHWDVELPMFASDLSNVIK